MKLTFAGTTGLILLCFTTLAGAETPNTKAKPRVARSSIPASSQKRLLATRKQLIERKKALKDDLENLLAVDERVLESKTADYEIKKELYNRDLISKLDLDESEQALTHIRLEIRQVQQWIAEDDLALSLAEVAAKKELPWLPNLPLGGYHEAPTLIRYNGAAAWSLADVGKVAKFFSERFGYALPISALGQSLTHDIMGFDHRDAMDVAVAPDSEEGRGLMAYLRAAGIPFMAFRSKVRGLATGAHIHIGRPSLRIEQVKRGSKHPVTARKNADDG